MSYLNEFIENFELKWVDLGMVAELKRGKTITKNTEAISIEYGVLKVQTKTPAWRQELQLQKIEIISKLNKKLNKKIIKDIRFI